MIAQLCEYFPSFIFNCIVTVVYNTVCFFATNVVNKDEYISFWSSYTVRTVHIKPKQN